MSAARTGQFARGIRWAVTWLHDSAKRMNDPHAKDILNGAAFNMGSDAAEYIARAARDAMPDMYEALNEAQAVLAVLIDPDSQHVSSQHVFAQATAAEAKARSAIAKAEGRS